jgi:hypothetical protein
MSSDANPALPLLLLFKGLVALAEPSVYTPEHVARITSIARIHHRRPNITCALAFGRHFAASVDRRTMLAIFAGLQLNDLHFTDNCEREHREGILSWIGIINHLSSSSSSSAVDRLSPRQAAEAYVSLLELVTGGCRVSPGRAVQDLWEQIKGDDEVLDAVGQALHGLVGESEAIREQVKVVMTSRLSYDHKCGWMCTVVLRSHLQDDDLLSSYFRNLRSQFPTPGDVWW